jgi:N-acetylmuramoyl-L-alanine amidase
MGMQRFRELTDAQLLAVCLYGEARGESREGKIAVASVIKERVKKGGWFGMGYHGVILKPYQFSCFLTSDPNFPKLYDIAGDFCRYLDKSKTLRRCYEIARGIIEGSIQQTLRATHYKTNNCKAAWADKMKKIATIDNHSFYGEFLEA